MNVRRRVSIALALMVVCAVCIAAQSGESVYVTKTGAKYHRAECRSLAKSKIEMSRRGVSSIWSLCDLQASGRDNDHRNGTIHGGVDGGT